MSSGGRAAREPETAATTRAALAALWRTPETQCVPPLIAAAQLSGQQVRDAEALARRLIEGAHHVHRHAPQTALLQLLALDSPAGLALLSLAEALLRVRDAADADQLIHDQLTRLRGTGGPIDALRATPTLGFVLRLAVTLACNPRGRVTRALLRALMRTGVRLLGGQFVFASDIQTAVRRARRAPPGVHYSFDMLGEAALTAADAQRYLSAYVHAIDAVGASAHDAPAPQAHAPYVHEVSVKLSALHPRYGYAQRERVLRELLPRLLELSRRAQHYRIALTIDAEESERLELSLDLIEAVMRDATLQEWSGLGVAVQAYQKRAPAVLEHLSALAAQRRQALRVRLVKGAYWDLEIKAAQLEGFAGYPVYTRKLYTDVAYLACARRLLADARLVAQFATHNARTIADVLQLALQAGRAPQFQCLYGMGTALYRQLAQLPVLSNGAAPTVGVYAPVGERAALLPYLMRRLLENGAGSSFVHRAARASVQSLVADPVAAAARLGGIPHPRIALPRELFAPERCNSAGLDLQSDSVRAVVAQAIDASRANAVEVRAMLAVGDAGGAAAAIRQICNPADCSEQIGTMHEPDAAAVAAALAAAAAGARSWQATASQTRAQLLEQAAARFEQQAAALIALIVREAGRTLADAIGEVREAIDALRYYAAQIRAQFDASTHVPLGVVLCISPWNFPLSIFTGQVGAALAAGNAVLAKPAEQTAATAALAVRLLREAGVPATALQLLPGDGVRIGMRLVGDERVRGVLFTGSTATARMIARTLAGRPQVPLIAETGGQNAMIVDSSALPEQVVADALRSAFDSAGQRCSSLRVLCLQEEIAAPVLSMLQGAMQELRIGDPAHLDTDVGPLIDAAARSRIETYVQSMRERILCRTPTPVGCERGVFLAPTLLRIDSLRELSGEVFGPVLHVLRFPRAGLPELVGDINASGYALTLGIASRIPGTTEAIVQHARAGNIYVNRNMIGAVIGVQPFGGQGLSGTGPKAGGPLYLHALLARSPGPHWPGPGVALAAAPSAPAALQVLIDWLGRAAAVLKSPQRERLHLRAQDYARRTLLGARLSLRGYVGESNELRLRPRGRLRATARSLAGLIEQLCASVATGNVLEAERTTLSATLTTALPPQVQAWLATARSDAADCQAVLVDADDAAADASWLEHLRAAWAAAEGPIVPVLLAGPDQGYPLERLIVEQTVTVNTAAVGGDAQLLSLQEEGG